MKIIAVIFLAFALPGVAVGQAPPGGNLVARSHSGQFIAYAPAPGSARLARLSTLETNTQYISLESTLLVISCERIKQALWRELGAPPSWRGRIHLRLRSARSADELVTIVSDRFTDGWVYHVELPDVLERSRFVRAIVQVLLVEMANRNAGQRSAEIPAWLVEGLARKLIASGEMEIFLPPPSWNVRGLTIRPESVSGQRPDPLGEALKKLRARPPLTFEELSWPGADQFSGEAGAVFQSSAQVFVDRLLSLPGGAACLRAMISELPRRQNWQVAFLDAFRPHFQRPLDVEKWWALQLVQFTGRDPAQTWTPVESWRKLDETLHQAVQVRTNGRELPMHTEISLQTIIREWDAARQTAVLQQKLNELILLRLRVSRNLIGLVDDYRRVIEEHLQKQGTSIQSWPFGRFKRPLSSRAMEDTARQLDALDARRAALRPASQGRADGAIEATPGASR